MKTKPLTLKDRIDYLIFVSGGTMPLDVVAYSDTELDEVRAALKGRRGAGKITVRLATKADLERNALSPFLRT